MAIFILKSILLIT